MKKFIKGFTLIEVLLGLTIFSIIALSLYSTFHSGIEINKRSEEDNKVYREARWLLDRLAKDLENMSSYDFANSYPSLRAFNGDENRLSLVLPTEEGLKVVSYLLQSPQQDTVFKTIIGRHTKRNVSFISRFEERLNLDLFVRKESSFADYLQTEPDKDIEEEILSTSVKEGSLKFSYAFLEGEGENAKITWRDSWKEKYLPSGVRIQITLVKSGRLPEPVTMERDIYIPTGYLGRGGL